MSDDFKKALNDLEMSTDRVMVLLNKIGAEDPLLRTQFFLDDLEYKAWLARIELELSKLPDDESRNKFLDDEIMRLGKDISNL